MKTIKLIFATASLFLNSFNNQSKAQTISTFEENILEAGSYWDGSLMPGGTTFTSGNAIFPNNFDSSFSYWASGWAYSNLQDSTTEGYTNSYAAYPAIGNNNSSNYAIGQQNSTLKLSNEAAGNIVNGVYITNGTYAALSMENGDDFAKKFGGESGNDPDYFKIIINGYYNGILNSYSVEFYLADFTFDNNDQDYIVSDWKYVDLTPLGVLDSLTFSLTSTDIGDFGINTPLFFCIDDLETSDGVIDLETNSKKNLFKVFPNPAVETLNIYSETEIIQSIQVTDLSGKIVYSISPFEINYSFDISHLESGIYFVSVKIDDLSAIKKIIKN